MRAIRHHDQDTEINITPMLDIVFIMLIFFIVTTSFAKEYGLDIDRPSKSPDTEKPDEPPIVVRIDSLDRLWIGERQVEPLAIRANLLRENAINPDAPLIIAAHIDATTDTLVAVLDAANIVGIGEVNVATQQ